MPFSTLLEEQFQEIADKKIEAIQFDQAQEIGLFCLSLKLAIITKFLLVSHVADKFRADLQDIKEFIETGFDIYATDQIIHFQTSLQLGAHKHTPYTKIPAFTAAWEIAHPLSAVKVSDEDKILEAKRDFYQIITSRLKEKLNDLIRLSPESRKEYIAQRNQKRVKVKDLQDFLRRRPAPAVEVKTLNENEWLEQQAIRMTLEIEEQEQAAQAVSFEEKEQEGENEEISDQRFYAPSFFAPPVPRSQQHASEERAERISSPSMRHSSDDESS